MLNSAQRRAVDGDGHSVIVACPGAGKTRVLVERTIRLRRSHPTAHIVLLTFTRQAAAELQNRLQATLSSLASLRVSTFHSLALQQLLSKSQQRICGPSEQVAILRLAAQGFIPEKDFRAFQRAVDEFTSGHSAALDQPQFQQAYDTYLSLLADTSSVDFGQGILKAVDGMDQGTIEPCPCDYLLVDECQDIDATQIRWVLAHTRNGAELTVVGDDDQSIYGFRLAEGHRGMLYLQRHHDARLVNLSINYRCRQEVLGMASKLIGHNQNRVPKDIVASRGRGGTVILHQKFWTDENETDSIAEFLSETSDQWAIIARTNRRLDRIAQALQLLKVKFTRPGRKAFWESEEPSLFLRMFDPGALSDRLVLAALASRIGVRNYSDTSPKSELGRVVRELSHANSLIPTNTRIQSIADCLCRHVSGIPKQRLGTSRDMLQHCAKYLSAMDGTITDRLQQARRPRSERAHPITLLTMHSAKGLEFPNVWIAGLQDGVVPNSKNPDIEEERRLLYVAISRAEDHLHMSFAWNLMIRPFERTEYTRALAPSRFLTSDLGLPMLSRREAAHAAGSKAA